MILKNFFIMESEFEDEIHPINLDEIFDQIAEFYHGMFLDWP